MTRSHPTTATPRRSNRPLADVDRGADTTNTSDVSDESDVSDASEADRRQ